MPVFINFAAMDYAVQYPALQRRYESLLADMQQVHEMLRRGRHRQALALLDSVLNQSDSSGTSDAEAEPIAQEDVTAALLSLVPGLPAAAFVGRGYRLDDEPGAADDVSDSSSHEPCCVRCGDRQNLRTFDCDDATGVWQNVDCAERTYCVDCLTACLSG